MAELKTKKTKASVDKFLNSVKDEKKRKDSYTILKLMKQITKEEPKMWGTSMVGFGSYHYKYATGREGDWFITGFSPRKQNLTLYIMAGISKYPDLLKKLGKHKTGKGCLYINKIEDIDIKILKELIKQSVGYLNKYNK
jgi:hypothetical protein